MFSSAASTCLSLRDVGGILHDFERSPGVIENRKVRTLNPNFLATFADAAEPARLLSSRGQIEPELAILGAARIGRIDKHAVMTTLNLVESIAHGLQKVVVGTCDDAIESKLDHGLHSTNRRDLSFVIGVAELCLRHIGGVFDDFERLARLVDDRAVNALDVDLAPSLGESAKLASHKLAAIQPLPHLAILGAGRIASSQTCCGAAL